MAFGAGGRGGVDPRPGSALRGLNRIGTRQGRIFVEGPRGTDAAERNQSQEHRDTEVLHLVTPLVTRCDAKRAACKAGAQPRRSFPEQSRKGKFA